MSGNVISQPSVSISVLPASQTISNAPQKVLFIGQKTASGTATAGALVQSIANDFSEDTLFGAKSFLAGMIRAAKRINGVTRMDAIALDDAGAGTAAAGAVVFTGTATAAGSFDVVVGSAYDHTYTVPVVSGDTPTAIGDKLVALITADTKAPFSAVNTAGSVAITFAHKGTVGNNTPLSYSGSAASVSVALTAFSGGATDPTLTTLFDVIAGERYQTIVWPSEYGFTTVTAELDARFNVTNDILDGVAIAAKTDTLANLKTAGNAENSSSLAILGNRLLADADHVGGSMLEFGYKIAAEFGAVRALRLTDQASIARYVTATSGARDAFGGTALATLPYFNTPFYELPIIPAGKGFESTEVEELGVTGVSVLGNNRARNTCIAGEIYTTRKTDSGGNPEDTFKYLNNVDASVNAREFFFNNAKARFAQCRLTEGALVPNRNMANQKVIEAFLDGSFTTIGGEDYVLVQTGSTALTYFQQNRTVTLDMLTGTVTVTMKLPIVVQLRTIIATMQIAFTTEA